jgi:alkylglycerol monooxygenase
MKLYATVLMYTIPIFFLLIFIEWVYGRIKGVNTIRSYDTISSISSGITNLVKDVLGLIVTIISYSYLYEKISLVHIRSTWLVIVLAFIGLDFVGYWVHRFEHVINIFWNRHIIHHSSEEFNLSCALRQNVSAIVAVFIFLYVPLAILGVEPKVIAIVGPIHLFLQFWYHTTLIKRMGFLEHILVTPSHHRVHHAINDVYLDKNYSQIFIIWDKMFGTFQEELASEPPVYGVKRQVKTWNPLIINFQHVAQIIKDAVHAKSWKDKLTIWFKPTGWRPADVQSLYPIQTITQPYNLQKYQSHTSPLKIAWAWVQLLICVAIVFHFLSIVGDFPFSHILLYGLFIVLNVYAYTSMMDGSVQAVVADVIKLLLFCYVGLSFHKWYNFVLWPTGLFCVITLAMNIYIYVLELKRNTGVVAK